jgi:hypothetical protein
VTGRAASSGRSAGSAELVTTASSSTILVVAEHSLPDGAGHLQPFRERKAERAPPVAPALAEGRTPSSVRFRTASPHPRASRRHGCHPHDGAVALHHDRPEVLRRPRALEAGQNRAGTTGPRRGPPDLPELPNHPKIMSVPSLRRRLGSRISGLAVTLRSRYSPVYLHSWKRFARNVQSAPNVRFVFRAVGSGSDRAPHLSRPLTPRTDLPVSVPAWSRRAARPRPRGCYYNTLCRGVDPRGRRLRSVGRRFPTAASPSRSPGAGGTRRRAVLAGLAVVDHSA